MPPNTPAAENPISIGRNTYAIFENRFANTYIEDVVSIFKKPFFTIKSSAFMIPIRNPEATMAGMIGTKISPKVFINLWNTFVLAAAAAFASSFVAPDIPATFINSSYTLSTVPVP